MLANQIPGNQAANQSRLTTHQPRLGRSVAPFLKTKYALKTFKQIKRIHVYSRPSLAWDDAFGAVCIAQMKRLNLPLVKSKKEI